MKQFFLSAGIICTFVLYSLYQRAASDPMAALTPTVLPSATPAPVSSLPPSGRKKQPYRDGVYTGDSVDAFYGYVQVRATVSGGRLTDVSFLDYPRDRHESMMISMYATPLLRQEAVQAQNSSVDIISGATDTSRAFKSSLSSALAKAV